MISIKKISIITFGLAALLIVKTPAHAIYSPTIAQKAFEIKENIVNSQVQHGTGTLTSMVEILIDAEQQRRQLGQVTGVPGGAAAARKELRIDALQEIYERPLDGLTSIFNYLASTDAQISNCLRDDLWTLEALKNQVVSEMMKAYMMADITNGNILRTDYQDLVEIIDILKWHGAGDPNTQIFHPETDEKMTVNQYLFGSNNNRNYYLFSYPTENGCPEGDFEQAFDQVARSTKTLETLFLGRGSDWNWDSIINAAEVRSKQRAAQWAEANQISLTLAGENGARQQSLIKGGGWPRLQGELETQGRIFEDIVGGSLTPLFNRSLWRDVNQTQDLYEQNCAYYYPQENVFRRCSEQELSDKTTCEGGTDEEKASIRCDRLRSIHGTDSGLTQFRMLEAEQAQMSRDVDRAKLAFSYSVRLNSVGEGNIQSLDTDFTQINGQIKRSIEALGAAAGPGLPSVRNNLQTFSDRHCINRQ